MLLQKQTGAMLLQRGLEEKYVIKWIGNVMISLYEVVFGHLHNTEVLIKKEIGIGKLRNGDRHQYYGTIFRAAHHYYYKDIKGLRRPPKNTFWKSQTRIRASRKQNADKLGSHLGVRRVWGLGDGIYIYTYGKSSSQTYATTIHELAHASHWNFQRINHNVSKVNLS